MLGYRREMAETTVFSTPTSFLSFASGRLTNGMPKLEDVAWDSGIATIPSRTLENGDLDDVRHIADESTYDAIVATYLILGVEGERFRAAYVAFSGRSNFDRVRKIFIGRYGEPDNSGSAPDNHDWIGNDLNIRLQYQADTDEGILAVTSPYAIANLDLSVTKY
jgi:hypothetical protein